VAKNRKLGFPRMKKINSQEVPETDQGSPHGKYRVFRRHLSVALGGKRDSGTWAGGHPFDLELTRIPAGAANFPLHQHSAQWELYIFLGGSGEMTNGHETLSVQAHDVVICPPEAPHKIVNTGADDLAYYVVADHQPADVVFYPETGKWGIKPQKKIFEMKEVDYFEPED
jgi:mannose-6-phosphate isomerase-like protein (cupin superfamily)